MGSKARIGAKLRQNDEFPAVTGFLNKIGFKWKLHAPTGKGHPFLTIRLPDGADMTHHVSCTPKGGGNPKAAISLLRRELKARGYDIGL